MGRIATPQRFAFFGVKRHGHHRFFTHVVLHRIPDKFPRRCPSEITNLIGFEDPRFRFPRFRCFVLFRFLGSHDEHWLLGRFCFLQSLFLFLCQDFVRIQQYARRSHNVVGRDGDADQVIAHLQCEFTAAKKLFVLPAVGVGVGAESRKPLGDFVQPVAVFFKIFTAAASADQFAVVDFVVPIDLE